MMSRSSARLLPPGFAHDLLHFDARLAPQLLRDGRRQWPVAARDAQVSRRTRPLRIRADRIASVVAFIGTANPGHAGHGGVDSDQARLPVRQRAARVARVERGVGLDHVLDEPPVPIAVGGRQRAA